MTSPCGESARPHAAATFRDVEKYALTGAPPHPLNMDAHSGWPYTVLWGPVTQEAAQAVGCKFAATSLLVKPAEVRGFVEARDAALACLHPDISIRVNWIPQSLWQPD